MARYIPKPGPGRPKGSKNKMTSVREMLEARNIDIFGELVDLLPKLNPSKRADVLLEIASFAHPKLKHSEINASVETNQGPQVLIVQPSNGREIIDGTHTIAITEPELKQLEAGVSDPVGDTGEGDQSDE